jgi:hypothetical protein
MASLAPQQRFSITCDDAGTWTLEGGTIHRPQRFADLPAALDCAKHDGEMAPATIELRVSGLYVCIHQDQGWPQRVCAPRRGSWFAKRDS